MAILYLLLAFRVAVTAVTVTANVTAMDWSKAVDQKTGILLEHCLARVAIGRMGRHAPRPA